MLKGYTGKTLNCVFRVAVRCLEKEMEESLGIDGTFL